MPNVWGWDGEKMVIKTYFLERSQESKRKVNHIWSGQVTQKARRRQGCFPDCICANCLLGIAKVTVAFQ